MKETIQGTVMLIILCLMSVLLLWGLSSPPTTIEFPFLFHLKAALLDVFHVAEAVFLLVQH